MTMVVPAHLLCPITKELMVNPVVASDSHTYERGAIERWLMSRETSPMTNEPMGKMMLPNQAIKTQVVEFCEQHGIEIPKHPPTLPPEVALIPRSDAPGVSQLEASLNELEQYVSISAASELETESQAQPVLNGEGEGEAEPETDSEAGLTCSSCIEPEGEAETEAEAVGVPVPVLVSVVKPESDPVADVEVFMESWEDQIGDLDYLELDDLQRTVLAYTRRLASNEAIVQAEMGAAGAALDASTSTSANSAVIRAGNEAAAAVGALSERQLEVVGLTFDTLAEAVGGDATSGLLADPCFKWLVAEPRQHIAALNFLCHPPRRKSAEEIISELEPQAQLLPRDTSVNDPYNRRGVEYRCVCAHDQCVALHRNHNRDCNRNQGANKSRGYGGLRRARCVAAHFGRRTTAAETAAAAMRRGAERRFCRRASEVGARSRRGGAGHDPEATRSADGAVGRGTRRTASIDGQSLA
eukprot:SAG11_NODE_2832_length_2926_cov_4.607496_2_plen_470_part_00